VFSSSTLRHLEVHIQVMFGDDCLTAILKGAFPNLSKLELSALAFPTQHDFPSAQNILVNEMLPTAAEFCNMAEDALRGAMDAMKCCKLSRSTVVNRGQPCPGDRTGVLSRGSCVLLADGGGAVCPGAAQEGVASAGAAHIWPARLQRQVWHLELVSVFWRPQQATSSLKYASSHSTSH
jgi:hypothetical protein